MDFGSAGNGNGSGDNYRRHTTYQTQQLEEFFKHCSHPDGAQQKQLSTELGLEHKQIKYWFQNRRTQEKAQHEKADFHALKLKYKKLKRKYHELKETCDKLKCRECMGSLIGRAPQLLPNENINEEDARVSRQAPVPQVQPLPTSLDMTLGLTGQGLCSSFDKREMVEMAIRAMDELTQLLESCNPFWVRSPVDGRLILDVDIYSKNFSQVNHFHNFSRLESSKDSSIVAMSARGLVDMFMDPNKWLDLFPTIVVKARKIEMLDTSILGDDAGTMLLMHGKLHILSPLVAPRDLYFLRYCKQIRPSWWVVADVSCKYSSIGKGASPLLSWKRPSGCLIQEKFNGSSEITWVEHVEVDSRYQINTLYRDILSGGGAYRAEIWLLTLQRMVERFQCFSGAIYHMEHGAITMPATKRSLMDLSQRMVKKFVAMLSLSTNPFLTLQLHNGVHVSVSRSDEPQQASGAILGVSSSVWLPVQSGALFNFLRDEKTRPQWDLLSIGNLEGEFTHISCGTHPGNCISVIRTSVANMMMLQESCTDQLGSLIVYAPVELSVLLETAFRGHSSENIFLAPSGFVICDSEKGRASEASSSTAGVTSYSKPGSILTVLIQVRTLLQLEKLPYSMVEKTSTVARSIVERIKVALGCPNEV